MKKILFCSITLFWWCLMFPIDSYTSTCSDYISSNDNYSFSVNDKEIRFKLLDFLFEM